jgi:heterodisulfide reductase subunit C
MELGSFKGEIAPKKPNKLAKITGLVKILLKILAKSGFFPLKVSKATTLLMFKSGEIIPTIKEATPTLTPPYKLTANGKPKKIKLLRVIP